MTFNLFDFSNLSTLMKNGANGALLVAILVPILGNFYFANLEIKVYQLDWQNPYQNLQLQETVPPKQPTTKTNFFPSSDYALLKTIGNDVWSLVNANRPTSKISGNEAHVVPHETDWTKLQNWNLPAVKYFRVEAINWLGISAFQLDYRISFSCGGQHQGVGQYLKGINIRIENLVVNWGYHLQMNWQVVNNMNIGSNDDPLAAAELVLMWELETQFYVLQGTINYLVTGDGAVFANSRGKNLLGR